ncbi:hypothetical protein J6590_007983 [Homalodisca vitripennis]|nr:hypothetical protein J6590_007983 [Homalodisca vitripennis]
MIDFTYPSSPSAILLLVLTRTGRPLAAAGHSICCLLPRAESGSNCVVKRSPPMTSFGDPRL